MTKPAAAPLYPFRAGFRPDIEGLRAVAVVLVVLFHAGVPFARAGFFGVDVFFVLSGFLITSILFNEIETTGTVSLVRFWARRARRLLPAAVLVTLVTLAGMVVVASPYQRELQARTAVAFAMYSSNALFAHRSADYLGVEVTHDPLLHTWSLSAEEQFYLVFAPTVLFIVLRTRSKGTDFHRRFGLAIAGLTVLSLVAWLVIMPRDRPLAFYSLPTRGWELGTGALVALARRRGFSVSPSIANAATVASLVSIVAVSSLGDRAYERYAGILTVIPVLATAGILALGFGERPGAASRLLATAPLRGIGRLSYSWYLWHWPMLVLLAEVVVAPSVGLRFAVAIASLAPAALAYAVVESPVRYSSYLAARPRQSLLGAAGLSLAVIAAAMLSTVAARRAARSPELAGLTAARAELSIVSWPNPCGADIKATIPRACVFGPLSDTTVVMFGDSHMAQWFPAVEQIALGRHWRLIPFTKAACPSVSVSVINGGTRYRECDTWRANAIRDIVALHPSLILISNRHVQPIVVGDARELIDSSDAALGEWRNGLARTIAAIERPGGRIAVLRDTPAASFDVPDCLAKHIRQPEMCAFARRSSDAQKVSAAEEDVVRASAAADWIDLTDAICGSVVCEPWRDGIPLLRDSNHLSAARARALAPPLWKALEPVLSGGRPPVQ